jgi:hypothetical protein
MAARRQRAAWLRDWPAIPASSLREGRRSVATERSFSLASWDWSVRDVDTWPHEFGREVIGGAHIFVLRLTLEPPGGGAPAPRLRLEAIGDGELKYFSRIDAALDHLRERLDAIVVSAGKPSGQGPEGKRS